MPSISHCLTQEEETAQKSIQALNNHTGEGEVGQVRKYPKESQIQAAFHSTHHMYTALHGMVCP